MAWPRVRGSVRLLRSFAALQALCQRAAQAPAAIVRQGEQIALAQRVRAPRISISTEVTLPFTCGVLRPVVILPASALQAESAELDFMLRHEITHVVRRDAALNRMEDLDVKIREEANCCVASNDCAGRDQSRGRGESHFR